MTGFIEVDDGIEVPEAIAPQMFERNFSEYMNFEDTGLKYEQLARPSTWHVLILPKQPRKMSSGGIALPDQVQQAEMHLNYIGQIVALGPLAGMNPKFLNPDYERALKDLPSGYRVENSETLPPRYLWGTMASTGFRAHHVGEWVLLGRYSGQVVTYYGVRLLTMNDDDILDGIDSPDGYRVYV